MEGSGILHQQLLAEQQYYGTLSEEPTGSGTLCDGAANASFRPKERKPYTITKQREKWSSDEHARFLEALRLYGRAWRKIEEHVGTKTAVQIRSHAQKFFTKIEKTKEGYVNEDVEPGISIPPPRPKRKPSRPYPRKDPNTLTIRLLSREGGSISSPGDASPLMADGSHMLTGGSTTDLTVGGSLGAGINGLPLPGQLHAEIIQQQQSTYHHHKSSAMAHYSQQPSMPGSGTMVSISVDASPAPMGQAPRRSALNLSGLASLPMSMPQPASGPLQLEHLSQPPLSHGGMSSLGRSNDITEATVAAVAAAASAAAAAAAAAVVAAAGQQVQARLQANPPKGFPFFGVPPSLLAQMSLPHAHRPGPVEHVRTSSGSVGRGAARSCSQTMGGTPGPQQASSFDQQAAASLAYQLTRSMAVSARPVGQQCRHLASTTTITDMEPVPDTAQGANQEASASDESEHESDGNSICSREGDDGNSQLPSHGAHGHVPMGHGAWQQMGLGPLGLGLAPSTGAAQPSAAQALLPWALLGQGGAGPTAGLSINPLALLQGLPGMANVLPQDSGQAGSTSGPGDTLAYAQYWQAVLAMLESSSLVSAAAAAASAHAARGDALPNGAHSHARSRSHHHGHHHAHHHGLTAYDHHDKDQAGLQAPLPQRAFHGPHTHGVVHGHTAACKDSPSYSKNVAVQGSGAAASGDTGEERGCEREVGGSGRASGADGVHAHSKGAAGGSDIRAHGHTSVHGRVTQPNNSNGSSGEEGSGDDLQLQRVQGLAAAHARPHSHTQQAGHGHGATRAPLTPAELEQLREAQGSNPTHHANGNGSSGNASNGNGSNVNGNGSGSQGNGNGSGSQGNGNGSSGNDHGNGSSGNRNGSSGNANRNGSSGNGNSVKESNNGNGRSSGERHGTGTSRTPVGVHHHANPHGPAMRPPAYAADRYPQHHETHDQDGNGASGIGARMNSGSEDPPSSGDDQDQGQGVERGAEERQQGQEGYTLQAATGGSAGTASGDGSGGAGGSGSGSGEGRGGVETPTPIGGPALSDLHAVIHALHAQAVAQVQAVVEAQPFGLSPSLLPNTLPSQPQAALSAAAALVQPSPLIHAHPQALLLQQLLAPAASASLPTALQGPAAMSLDMQPQSHVQALSAALALQAGASAPLSYPRMSAAALLQQQAGCQGVPLVASTLSLDIEMRPLIVPGAGAPSLGYAHAPAYHATAAMPAARLLGPQHLFPASAGLLLHDAIRMHVAAASSSESPPLPFSMAVDSAGLPCASTLSSMLPAAPAAWPLLAATASERELAALLGAGGLVGQAWQSASLGALAAGQAGGPSSTDCEPTGYSSRGGASTSPYHPYPCNQGSEERDMPSGSGIGARIGMPAAAGAPARGWRPMAPSPGAAAAVNGGGGVGAWSRGGLSSGGAVRSTQPVDRHMRDPEPRGVPSTMGLELLGAAALAAGSGLEALDVCIAAPAQQHSMAVQGSKRSASGDPPHPPPHKKYLLLREEEARRSS